MPPNYVPAEVPVAGNVVTVMLQMVTFGVLAFGLTRRAQRVKKWHALSLVQWLILLIYLDSGLFVFATSIVTHGFGINSSLAVCEGAIFLCLLAYMTTKVLIYYFLVERAWVVSGNRKPRLQSKLWLFNCVFMILPYTTLVILNSIFRIAHIDQSGVCVIGMQRIAMIPLIIFEVLVNVYLTLLFIIPLRALHSYKTNANPALARMAQRSFWGSCATLTTSVINLTVSMVLKGEPGWICLMCCNADILFCVVVLHWVTSKEQRDEDSAFRSTTKEIAEGDNPIDKSRHVSSLKMEDSPDSFGPPDNNKALFQTRTGPMVGTITTEIKSVPQSSTQGGIIRALHRRGSGDDASDSKIVLRDEVEMNHIRVQHTIHTREMDADEDERGDRNESVTTSTDGRDDWMPSGKGVVGERMV